VLASVASEVAVVAFDHRQAGAHVTGEFEARLTDVGVMPGGEARSRSPIIGVNAPCAMIVTMACDEDLANRIRELIASEDGYTEQKMFGGIGFTIDGHTAVGVSGEDA
jgi:hypothetical protein